MNPLFLQGESKCEVVWGQIRWHLHVSADNKKRVPWKIGMWPQSVGALTRVQKELLLQLTSQIFWANF